MRSTLRILALVGLVGHVSAAPADSVPEDWDWDAHDLGVGQAYLVSDNITIDPFEAPDPTLPGVTLLEFSGPPLGAPREETDLEQELEGEYAPHALEARQSSYKDVISNYFLGKTHVEWGCETSVRTNVRRAIEHLCWSGNCDKGTKYVVRVKRAGCDVAKRRQLEGNLVFSAEGLYVGNVRHRIIEALQATSVSKTHSGGNREWSYFLPQTGSFRDSCHLTRFPNYISVERRNKKDRDVRDWIQLSIAPPVNDNKGICAIASVLTAIAGAIHGIAGGFFGAVTPPLCN